MERAILEYGAKNWKDVEKFCLLALSITEHKKTYINEVFSWDNTVYDLSSISSFYLEKYDDAYEYVKIALDMNPNDERIKNNLDLIEEKITIL